MEKEPVYCAEARILDAASWIIKAAAQLSTVGESCASDFALILEATACSMLDIFPLMAEKGSREVGAEAHKIMTRHALLQACAHAWYVQSPSAKDLLAQYRSITSPVLPCGHPDSEAVEVPGAENRAACRQCGKPFSWKVVADDGI